MMVSCLQNRMCVDPRTLCDRETRERRRNESKGGSSALTKVTIEPGLRIKAAPVNVFT